MKEYSLFWKKYVDFDSKTGVRGFWIPALINFVIDVVLGILIALLPALSFISGFWGLAIIVPSITIGVRRFRDAGCSQLNWLWILLPVVGWIICVVLWASPSKNR